MDTRWPRNSLFVRAFKIIKVKRFNAVTEEMRESEDSMQMAAQDARRLSFAARRNKLEMETLSEEKEKIKEKKRMFLFLSRTVATEFSRFDKIFPGGTGALPCFIFALFTYWRGGMRRAMKRESRENCIGVCTQKAAKEQNKQQRTCDKRN